MFKKILLFIIIVSILLTLSILGISYSYYKIKISEQSLETRIQNIVSNDNYITFEKLPQQYINALLSIEDHRYYNHGAIDIIAIGRSIITNIKSKEITQGGSTLTQQVAKNLVFNQDQNIIRKISEIFVAYDLEKLCSKDEIIALYANISYFGDGNYGIYDASKNYFNKSVSKLTLEECCMLAGIPNAPSIYAPTINPDLTHKRKNQVLNKMIEYGYISEKEANL